MGAIVPASQVFSISLGDLGDYDVNADMQGMLSSFLATMPIAVEQGRAMSPTDVLNAMIQRATITCAEGPIYCQVPTTLINSLVAQYQTQLQAQQSLFDSLVASGAVSVPTGSLYTPPVQTAVAAGSAPDTSRVSDAPGAARKPANGVTVYSAPDNALDRVTPTSRAMQLAQITSALSPPAASPAVTQQSVNNGQTQAAGTALSTTVGEEVGGIAGTPASISDVLTSWPMLAAAAGLLFLLTMDKGR